MKQSHKGISAVVIICAVFGFLFMVCGIITLATNSGSTEFTELNEPGESAIGIILNILRGNDQEMQAAAIAMVREIPGTEITKALAKELPNLSATSQVQLLSALAQRGDKVALPAVVAAANVENESVRVTALKALGPLGDASSVNFLAQRAATATGDEQKAARDSLYRLRGADVDDTVLASIDKAEPKTKVELIRSIGERNIYAGVKTLLKTAQDADSNVRIESFKVLKVVADPDCLSNLIKLLLSVSARPGLDGKAQGGLVSAERAVAGLERNEAENATAAIARKIGHKGRQVNAILEALSSVQDINGRCSLLNVLGKIGDDSSLPVLRQAMKDKDIKVQDSAIRALSDWPNPTPIADLLDVAQKSDNKVHQIIALRGFVRLIGLDSYRPAEETINLYRQAMNLAPDVSIKTSVLSGLANVSSFVAFQMACEYLNDSSLQQEAELAVVKIAPAIIGSHPEETKVILNKIIQTTKNDTVRQQAKELISRIERGI